MSDVEIKSYRYLRMAIVVLLIGLGISVWYQTQRQDFRILGSISAYYYTPAQPIFVGVLMAAGACMIALKGTTETEDVILNLGGAAAAVVALVPTTRGEDFETAVRACRQAGGPLLTDQASGGPDCPTVQALADATRANVENNMTSLLIVGGLSLAVTLVFALADRRSSGRFHRRTVWGFAVTAVAWAAACVALWGHTDWFVRNGHFAAAIGLFGCVFVVTVSNALRHHGKDIPEGPAVGRVLLALRHAREALFGWPLRQYAWVAWSMMAGVVIMGTLFLLGIVTLFWLEVVVALLFIAFWLVQTVELFGGPTPREPAPDGPRPGLVQSLPG